jgi:6-phosphogluconate dehydrogenase
VAAYQRVEPILLKIAAQVDDGPCVTHIGAGMYLFILVLVATHKSMTCLFIHFYFYFFIDLFYFKCNLPENIFTGGSGNYVKMVHNGIEYGDMQLIAEAYDLLKNIGGLTNEELHEVFAAWNKTELQSFLIEITADIFLVRDGAAGGHVVDKILDKTGSKGTGKWTVQQAAEQAVPAPTMAAALDARYLSAVLSERVAASAVLRGPDAATIPKVEKAQLIDDVRRALYAAKICSYAQGMNLIRTAGKVNNWNLNLGAISRIWKGGCIIRAVFLDRIKVLQLCSIFLCPSFCSSPLLLPPFSISSSSFSFFSLTFSCCLSISFFLLLSFLWCML